MGWRNGSVAERTGCSSKGPGSNPRTYTYIAASAPGCLSSASLAVIRVIARVIREERVYFILKLYH